MVAIQNMLNSLRTTKILINMLASEEEDDYYFLFNIMELMILLVEEGNTQVQNTIYNQFTTNSNTEKFFKKIYTLIEREIAFSEN